MPDWVKKTFLPAAIALATSGGVWLERTSEAESSRAEAHEKTVELLHNQIDRHRETLDELARCRNTIR